MKDLKISKELFNEVTNSKCHEVFIKNEFIIAHSNLGMKMVNIYEFAFIKCKEWAMNKGYQIISGLSDEPAYRKQDEKAYAKVLWYVGDDIHREYKDMYFMANTEIEAVVKASEYIY